MTQSRLIPIAGLVAWLMVGLPAFLYHAGAVSPNGRWVLAYLLFDLLFAADLRRPRLLLAAAESAPAIALTQLGRHGYWGTLLANLALQLGTQLEPNPSLLLS